MNSITSIFSTACLLVSALAVALAMMLSVSIAMAAEKTLPVKAEIIDCTTPEQIEHQCYTNGYCCELIEPASGDEVFAEWTPEEENRESYVPMASPRVRNDVIVE